MSVLTARGTVKRVERRPWKKTKPEHTDRHTTFLVIGEGGYNEKIELDYRLDEHADAYVGHEVEGPVRVFNNYDENTRRFSTRVVLVEVEVLGEHSLSAAA